VTILNKKYRRGT
jgi:hypothetical protein